MDKEESSCTRVDAHDFGNLDTHLAPARGTEAALTRVGETVERVRALAPTVSGQAPGDIECHVVAGREEVSLRFHGLEFARVAPDKSSYGLGRQQRPLTEKSFRALGALLKRLQRERAPGGPARSSYYRAQPERWRRIGSTRGWRLSGCCGRCRRSRPASAAWPICWGRRAMGN